MAGRDTKYLPEYNEQAYKLALLGATDAELADFFGVCEATINNWKIEFPQFLESIREGKVKADSEVAHKLYDRAMGAEWVEDVAFKIRNQTATGVFTEDVKIVGVRKAAPPDTQAISLWLRNRKSDKWKDKAQTELSGEIAITKIERTVVDPANKDA